MNMPKPKNRKSLTQHMENATVAAEDKVHVRVSMANAARDLEEKDIPVSFNGTHARIFSTWLVSWIFAAILQSLVFL